jgi:hypothetical protein
MKITSYFDVLDVLFGRVEASLVVLKSFMEAYDIISDKKSF